MKHELNCEYPDKIGEKALVDEMLKLAAHRTEELVGEGKIPQGGCPMRRQHAKPTGCVRAVFKIREDLPDYLAHGVFGQAGRTYEAVVRFSNASETRCNDAMGAARGMAIKLLDVDGTPADSKINSRCQDFLMVNHPVFPFATPAEYVKFFHIRDALGGREWAETAAALTTALAHPKLVLIIKEMREKKAASSLESTYWSGSPYWLGRAGTESGRVVKYSAAPIFVGTALPADVEKLPKGEHHPEKLPAGEFDYLGNALQQRLKSQAAVFDFRVQLQTDPEAMPVEDVFVEWNETVSTPVCVATLTIGVQDVTSPAGCALAEQCEAMAFSPWNALAEHRPMGGINRLRKEVYLASQAKRAS